MSVIDVGAAAIDRNLAWAPGYTVFTLDNPANKSGIINSIEMWAYTSLPSITGAKIITASRDGAKFTPRDSVTIGTVTAGSKQTITTDVSSNPIALQVEAGDYIGIYYPYTADPVNGRLEISDEEGAGGAGTYYKTGDQTGAGEQTYLSYPSTALSLYVTGITVAPTVTTQAATIIVPGGATLNGNITNDGGESITQHGFCWKIASDPVDIAGADGYSELGVGAEGAFDQAKTGFEEHLKLYYRAYATNTEGTSYGAAQSWTTGQTHSGVVVIAPAVGVQAKCNNLALGVCPIAPAVGVEAIANYICIAVCPIGVAVAQAAIGNRIAHGVCAIALTSDIETIASGISSGAASTIGIETGLSVVGNRLAVGVCPVGVALGLDVLGEMASGGSMQMTPGLSISALATSLWNGGAAIAPGVDVESIANLLWNSASSAIGVELGLSVIGNRTSEGACSIGVALGLALLGEIYIWGSTQITPGVSISAAANAFWSGSAACTPAVALVLDGAHLATAIVSIAPEIDVAVTGNYITCAVAAIAVAVSLESTMYRIIDGGSVAITVAATVEAAAIRYMFAILGYSGEFGAGSVIRIDSDKMTFTKDGVNAIKDIVGSFMNVPPGDSTVSYEDDEGTRDVTLKLEYTQRDA